MIKVNILILKVIVSEILVIVSQYFSLDQGVSKKKSLEVTKSKKYFCDFQVDSNCLIIWGKKN